MQNRQPILFGQFQISLAFHSILDFVGDSNYVYVINYPILQVTLFHIMVHLCVNAAPLTSQTRNLTGKGTLSETSLYFYRSVSVSLFEGTQAFREAMRKASQLTLSLNFSSAIHSWCALGPFLNFKFPGTPFPPLLDGVSTTHWVFMRFKYLDNACKMHS